MITPNLLIGTGTERWDAQAWGCCCRATSVLRLLTEPLGFPRMLAQ